MTNDPTFVNLPLLTTFLKHFDRAYLGATAESGSGAKDDGSYANGGQEKLPSGVEELVPADGRQTVRSMFVGYFNSASKTLVKGQVVSALHTRERG